MYLLIKTVHILAVVMFLGNITTGLFWHRQAARTRDARLLAFTMSGIIRSDRWFTTPGVLLIVASGVLAAVVGRLPLLGTGWILWTLVLFTVSGAAFGMRVAPLQRQLLALAETGVREGKFDYDGYHAVSRRWEFWGAVALATPLIGLVLMVLKPAL